MLKKIELYKFKCYDKHEIDFKNLSVIVGKNNAGKSTLIEALRILSIIINRFKNLSFNPPPAWLELPRGTYGVRPSLRNIDIEFNNVVYNYEDGPAKIVGLLTNNIRIETFLREGKNIFALIYD